MVDARAPVAALVALVMAGCGGGGDEGSGQVSLTGAEPKLEQVAPEGAGTGARPAAEEEKRPARKERPRKQRAAKPKDAAPGSELPAAKRAVLVQRIAPAVVTGLGFGNAKITTDGSDVTIAVARGKACALGPKGPATLRERLANSLPFARSITLVVEGGGALAAYAASNCEPPAPPAARGKLVLEQQGGPGTVNTKSFKVTSKKWTVAYANAGEFLQVFAVKGDEVQSPAVSATKSGKGKQTFKGPGTFTLRITGSGDWGVEVRDGG